MPRIERYENGKLVESKDVESPVPDESHPSAQDRVANLEARVEELAEVASKVADLEDQATGKITKAELAERLTTKTATVKEARK